MKKGTVTTEIELTKDEKRLKYDLLSSFSSSSVSTEELQGLNPEAGNLEHFIDCVKALIENDQEDKEFQIKLIDEYVDENIFQDPQDPNKDLLGIVECSVLSRSPAKDHSARDLKPRVVDVVKDDPNYPGENVVWYMQRFDNIVSFKMVAPTATDANRMANWFEDLMVKGSEFFSLNGFNHFYFEEREADQYMADSKSEQGAYIRPLNYYVRTRKVYKLNEKTLDRLVVLMSTTTT